LRYRSVCVEALHHQLPEAVIRSSVIEKMLSTTYTRLKIPPGTLEMMTGVQARRFWPEGYSPSSAAIEAAENLLRESGFDRSRLGALISTSVSKEYLEPSVAALVHGALKLPARCLNFDLGNACLGFLSGISLMATLIEGGQIEAGLVVAGEGSRAVTLATAKRLMQPKTRFEDYRDNLATLTLGSAGAAMLLTHERLATQGHHLLNSVSLAATQHCRLCLGSAEGMITQAPKLLKEGVLLAQQTWTLAQEELGLNPSSIKEFVLHQVGRANHEAIIKTLQLPEERALRLYPELGNVGAVGVPLTLSMLLEQGRVQAGDHLLLMGIGSGLNTSMMEIKW